MTRLHVPQAWRETAETILAERLRKVLVLGAGDRGKSTFCKFLVRELVAAGHRAALIDACIGQKDIGPPATITLGHAEGTADTAAMQAEHFYFVGSTSPLGRLLPMVVGTSKLARLADAPFVVIDTTGFVEGPGRVLKSYKIEAVEPDLIVAIKRREELESILSAYATYRTIRIRPSRHARPRDSWQRFEARRDAFAAYFKNAQRCDIDLEGTAVQRSLIFTGIPTEVEGAVYAERTPEGIVAVCEQEPVATDVVKCLRPGFGNGLLCGLADENNLGLGLAILEKIDFSQGVLSLLSPVAADRIRVLQLGDLYIDSEGYELGTVGREGL